MVMSAGRAANLGCLCPTLVRVPSVAQRSLSPISLNTTTTHRARIHQLINKCACLRPLALQHQTPVLTTKQPNHTAVLYTRCSAELRSVHVMKSAADRMSMATAAYSQPHVGMLTSTTEETYHC